LSERAGDQRARVRLLAVLLAGQWSTPCCGELTNRRFQRRLTFHRDFIVLLLRRLAHQSHEVQLRPVQLSKLRAKPLFKLLHHGILLGNLRGDLGGCLRGGGAKLGERSARRFHEPDRTDGT
jgi:hypothetical protein